MPAEVRRVLLQISYEEAARQYLSRLPLEHFMESTPQAKQREITLESLALVKAQRSDVHVFNELLVQYPLPRRKRPGQVVPDNMVVLYHKPIKARGSYDLPLQPVAPFWMLEYVSPGNKRKDYTDNMKKYEHDLKVPYYLLFLPESQDLTLYHHTGGKYVSVKPNAEGRYEIPELELDVGVHAGWMRYWLRGELLPLPAELQRQLEGARRQLARERQARLAAEQENARLRAELEQLKRGRPERER